MNAAQQYEHPIRRNLPVLFFGFAVKSKRPAFIKQTRCTDKRTAADHMSARTIFHDINSATIQKQVPTSGF